MTDGRSAAAKQLRSTCAVLLDGATPLVTWRRRQVPSGSSPAHQLFCKAAGAPAFWTFPSAITKKKKVILGHTSIIVRTRPQDQPIRPYTYRPPLHPGPPPLFRCGLARPARPLQSRQSTSPPSCSVGPPPSASHRNSLQLRTAADAAAKHRLLASIEAEHVDSKHTPKTSVWMAHQVLAGGPLR